MKSYYERIRTLAFSATAKDTLILFVGNGFSAFWGFLYKLFVARALSLYDYGVFSAVLNLVIILSSLADIGISTGALNFVAEHSAKGDSKKVNEYIKAAFVIRLTIVLMMSGLVWLFSHQITSLLLASSDNHMAIWVAVISIFLFPDMFFQYILQAKRKFLESTIYDNSFYFARLAFVLVFLFLGALTINRAYWAFGAGFLVTIVLTFVYLKKDFLFAKPTKVEYKNLLGFSGWIAVNRIISSVSGKLDVQMVAAMVGAVSTALYSIPSSLASFIIVLSSSFSSVLATRMAGFADKAKEKAYIVKSTLALFPITAGIIVWIILAKPFILILFGAKYLPSVSIFQVLTAAQIPFLFTVPSVTAIIYSMKKTVYIGAFSFFQLAAIFLLNLLFIPKYGALGPTFTLAIINTVLAVYTWVIVVKHYWLQAK